MKNKFLKKVLNWSMVLVAATMILSSCNKDDDKDPPVVIEDGIYVKGLGTALTGYDAQGLMTATTNEADDNAARAGLYDLYVAVEGGADGFNIIIVTGGEPTIYGPGADYALVTEVDGEEPQNVDFWRGSYADVQTSVNPFTVNTDGLYHIVLDTQLGIVAVAEAEWGVIGGATPNGWGGSTVLDAGAFDLNKISFETTDIIMLAGEYKFRYSDGWKIILDGENVRANTNFGGTLDALVAGGSNMNNDVVGVYTVNMTWELGVGHTATLTKTGDYTPPAFPDAMYIVGDATAYGWDTPGSSDSALFHKCAGGAPTEGIFWKICYIETGKGFKIAAENWGDPDIGFTNVDEYDANGVTISDNGGNMSVAASGMYMVVLNLQDDMKKVSVIAPEVYGIGDAFGANDWAEDAASCLFTVDDVTKTLTSPALTADGNIRMYADHAWIPAWWNAEFNVYTTTIEYRNDGGDQAAVPGTTGQVITLTFDDNTGVIN
ncbi:MAG: SusF/SusE family outer membrane protein [Bacteroidota bacterium]|nr:SusF/SusE family outer membrane protein [Bacteroidota bacterium]